VTSDAPIFRPSGSAPSRGGSAEVLRFPRRRRTPHAARAPRRPTGELEARLGALLLEAGEVEAGPLAQALLDRRRQEAGLADILRARGAVGEDALLDAVARLHGMGRAGPPPAGPAAEREARELPLDLALTYRALPWGRVAGLRVVATARPEAAAELRAALPRALASSLFVVASDAAIDARLQVVHGRELARQAECRVPDRQSCRDWGSSGAAYVVPAALLGTGAAACAWPGLVLAVLTLLALASAAANLALRCLALLALRRDAPGRAVAFASVRRSVPRPAARLPRITMLVPMHDEPRIAASLMARLGRLDYPRSLLDVVLVVEDDDYVTLAALGAADLPPWIRTVAVPPGLPRTKPRAMNYALNFARGSIVGVWDAEDAPEADQLRRVAARMGAAPPETACLQGKLDFYNADRNWIARCFTIDYALWFRLLLPGIERMGLAIPLGGTTLFFRREALERIGAWDAHNVTEDADLGIRLARAGYRTEVLDTTTLEEANAAALPWVKQRSRWLKGYMMTWAVHMRQPGRLWAELGAWRFLGVQWLFGGAVLNAMLLPFAWMPIVATLGGPHPFAGWLSHSTLGWLSLAVVGVTLGNMALASAACAAPAHRHLRRSVPLLEAYFPLATLAIWKAAAELTLKPFHWDKTEHGAFGGADEAEVEPEVAPPAVVRTGT
jgi:hypothetical protein